MKIRKGVDYLSGYQGQCKTKEIKKARYGIVNVSMNNLSKIIREFEKLPYEGYERKRPEHELTDSYFYVAIQLAKCMMRSDDLNLDIEPVRTEMTGTQNIPISHVCSKDESKSKEFLADKHKTLIDYNDRNNGPLSNEKIRESIH